MSWRWGDQGGSPGGGAQGKGMLEIPEQAGLRTDVVQLVYHCICVTLAPCLQAWVSSSSGQDEAARKESALRGKATVERILRLAQQVSGRGGGQADVYDKILASPSH
jgi:hypothetical protein